jgi:Icc-related predicted phosphoesterase
MIKINDKEISELHIEDGLSSNAPHIRELKKYRMHYILGAKKDDHAFLFDHVESATKEGLTTEIEYQNDDVVHQFRFINQVPLNTILDMEDILRALFYGFKMERLIILEDPTQS